MFDLEMSDFQARRFSQIPYLLTLFWAAFFMTVEARLLGKKSQPAWPIGRVSRFFKMLSGKQVAALIKNKIKMPVPRFCMKHIYF
jgi:hypothetical protein